MKKNRELRKLPAERIETAIKKWLQEAPKKCRSFRKKETKPSVNVSRRASPQSAMECAASEAGSTASEAGSTASEAGRTASSREGSAVSSRVGSVVSEVERLSPYQSDVGDEDTLSYESVSDKGANSDK